VSPITGLPRRPAPYTQPPVEVEAVNGVNIVVYPGFNTNMSKVDPDVT
jgi:hypothetical protein